MEVIVYLEKIRNIRTLCVKKKKKGQGFKPSGDVIFFWNFERCLNGEYNNWERRE